MPKKAAILLVASYLACLTLGRGVQHTDERHGWLDIVVHLHGLEYPACWRGAAADSIRPCHRSFT